MNRLMTAILCLLLCGEAWGAWPAGYYDRLDGKKKEALKAAAKQAVMSHQTLNYTNLPIYWESSDVYPDLVANDRGEMCKRWWDMYSAEIYLIWPGQAPKSSFSANGMQREHAVPKSWWKKDGSVEYTSAYSDMWNLYPSDGPANQRKSNYPFGTVRTASFDNGVTKIGSVVTGQGGGSGTVFEPADEYKGDFARACFYMATVYDDLPWVVTYMFRQETWPTLQPWAVDMLLQWARTDKVSQKEIMRNDAVQQCQGNRNPFIDFPELAEFIWGTRTDETFSLEDQGGTTPPITGDPELTSPQNGETLDFGEGAVGMAYNRGLVVAGGNLTSSLSVLLSGTDKKMFSISETSIPASAINSNGSYILQIGYTPTAEGTHTASLLLYDGGLPGGKSIRVTLKGEGLPMPQLSTLTALEPTDVTDTSYTANWTEAPEVVDYYVVNRVRYSEEGDELEVYESPVNHITFTDRNPGTMESYTVSSSRLGVLSPVSNAVMIAGSGVDDMMAYTPFRIGAVEGGFTAILEGEHSNLRVYSVSGTLVMREDIVKGGDTFLLPPGIYIVTTDQASRPVKIIVSQ